jgi:hypothetical protein
VSDRPAEKQLFLGKVLPLVLSTAVLILLGVLAVDRFIERQQIQGSTEVAASTIATSRLVGAAIAFSVTTAFDGA